jgi:hypothetical protein
LPQTNAGMWKYLVAASVALAIVSSYMAYDYRIKWKSASDALPNCKRRTAKWRSNTIRLMIA